VSVHFFDIATILIGSTSVSLPRENLDIIIRVINERSRIHRYLFAAAKTFVKHADRQTLNGKSYLETCRARIGTSRCIGCTLYNESLTFLFDARIKDDVSNSLSNHPPPRRIVHAQHFYHVPSSLCSRCFKAYISFLNLTIYLG